MNNGAVGLDSNPTSLQNFQSSLQIHCQSTRSEQIVISLTKSTAIESLQSSPTAMFLRSASAALSPVVVSIAVLPISISFIVSFSVSSRSFYASVSSVLPTILGAFEFFFNGFFSDPQVPVVQSVFASVFRRTYSFTKALSVLGQRASRLFFYMDLVLFTRTSAAIPTISVPPAKQRKNSQVS